MRIHKVYTKTGDKGTTDLLGGVRLPKDHLRIESYGTIDELQAHIGAIYAALRQAPRHKTKCKNYAKIVHRILNDLFDLGSILATPPKKSHMIRKHITEKQIRTLELAMDEWTPGLKPLPSFVLSGGGTFSVISHIARTVCRRAERAVIRLNRKEEVPADVIRYLNRLSDFLFVFGRHLATLFKEEEPLWDTPLTKPMGTKRPVRAKKKVKKK